MIKCVYNELNLGDNLRKNREKKKRNRRPKSNSLIRATDGVVTPKDKTRVILPGPIDTNEILCLNDKIKRSCSSGPFYKNDSCFGNKQGHLCRGPLR